MWKFNLQAITSNKVLNLNILIKKAPFIIGAFFCAKLYASTPHLAIERAQELVLKNKRSKALDLLSKEIKNQNLDKAVKEKLISKRTQILRLFLKDKTQNLFEKAQSLYLKDPKDSLELYKEANKLEPQNILVTYGLLRNYLTQKQCSEAKKHLEGWGGLVREEGDLRYMYLRTKECLGELSEVKEKDFEIDDPQKEKYVLELKAHWLSDRGHKKKANKLAKLGIKSDKLYSENYYWAWKTSSPKSGLRHLKKYKRLCESILPEVRKKYLDSLSYCSRIELVPDEIE